MTSTLPGIKVGKSQPESKSQKKRENEVSITVSNYPMPLVLLVFQEETWKSLRVELVYRVLVGFRPSQHQIPLVRSLQIKAEIKIRTL